MPGMMRENLIQIVCITGLQTCILHKQIDLSSGSDFWDESKIKCLVPTPFTKSATVYLYLGLLLR